MAYLGNTPTQQGFTPAIDYFSGNASTTAFTLSRPVASVAQVQAVIENVPQNPGDAFTVSGNTITFTSAPPSGTNNIYVYYTSPITTVVQPGQGTVSNTQMTSGAAVANIGYTPVNKAGDTMTGSLSVASSVVVNGATTNTNANWGYFINPKSGGAVGDFTVTRPDGNVSWLSIDGSGRVTTPYQPAFRATAAGGGLTTATPIPYGTEVFDIGSNYNTSTYRFTAPVAGVYHFDAGTYINNNTTAYGLIRLDVNGSQVKYAETQSVALVVSLEISIDLYLNANDYVSVGWTTSSGRQYFAGGSESHFCGHLVG